MQPQPEVYLHDLSETEKQKLISIARRNVKRMGIVLLPPALIAAVALVYINMNKYQLKLDEQENLHAVLNVSLVIIFAFLVRMFISHVISLRKESKNWQKRVVHGKIHGKKGNTVYIGRQTVKLDSASASKANIGDDVEISISVHAGFIIDIVKRGS
ncbi:MAG: hypothetical protein FD123_3208 [Bacteroidetes bacterium]|nr:MAG: hypothetical protein FD123_3208 [Bacteroidota bacterium]